MTQPSMMRRRGGYRRRGVIAHRPFRQGDLDGLCGVYSVVNAIRVLCPELDRDDFEWLFDHLMQSIGKAGADPAVSVAGGIGQRVFAALVREAIRQLAAEYDISLLSQRLPKRLRRSTTLAGFWRLLAARLSPTCVAVLGTEGYRAHWTIAVHATTRQIRLFDSGQMQVLRRGDCTVGKAANRTGISLPHAFLIERGD